jgi:hypothetical protein
MTTRTTKVRFFGAAKRLTKDPWPDCLPPVTKIASDVAALTAPDDLISVGQYTIVGRLRSSHTDYAHLVFYRIRNDVLPSLRDATTGAIEAWDLDQDSDLAEATEVLLLRSGLVLQLVNRDGPGIGSIAKYIERVSTVDIDMVALLHDDPLAQLGAHPEIQMVKIRAASGSAAELAQGHASLREAGRSADRAPGTKSIEMIYRAETGQKDRFSGTWMPRIRRLLGRPGIERITVTQYDDDAKAAEEIDLLQDRITATAHVELTNDNRYITAGAAREALLTAYQGMKDVVDPALGALLDEERAAAAKED